MPDIKRIDASKYHNIFVATDIHGELDFLLNCMKELAFDRKNDLLIVLGDMVDRGQRSFDTLHYCLNASYIEPTQANHEDMAYAAIVEKVGGMRDHWDTQGGVWGRDYPDASLEALLAPTAELPYAIELDYNGRTIAMAHAYLPNNWVNVRESLTDAMRQSIIWKRPDFNSADALNVIEGVDLAVFGHTICPERAPRMLGNRLYIDTGAYKWSGAMTLLHLPVSDKDGELPTAYVFGSENNGKRIEWLDVADTLNDRIRAHLAPLRGEEVK